MKKINILLIITLILALSACHKWWGNDDSEENNPYKGLSAKELFQASQQAMKKEQYSGAIKRLEALETMYPFNDYAEQAQINLLYAYYEKGEYPSTAATAERFIHLYPRAPHVDYAYYMKGLANFQQARGVLANILPFDESRRDPGTQAQAYSDFATLVQKFPQSKYNANAMQRLIYLRNNFALRELHAANYYYEHKMYVAASERATYLLKTYQQAPSAQQALALLYHTNLKLGLKHAAADALTTYRTSYNSNPL